MAQQQVPEGYQQTEVGVIPEDWKVTQVQDVCGFIVPGRNKPRCFDGDIPWITTPDLEDGRTVYKSRSSLRVTKAEAKFVGSKVVPEGSVIMTCVGELGIVALTGCEMVLNQQLHAFLPSAKVNSSFLVYALKRQEAYFYTVATKTALPYINKDNCNATPIPLPCLKEQTAIANALSDVDTLITSLEKLIAKKRAIKTAAMQQLLTGKKRLPPFDQAHTGYKQTELGEIPADWEVNYIGRVLSITTGDKNTQDKIDDGLYPFFVRSQTIERINSYSFDGEAVLTAGDGVGTGKIYHYINGKFDYHQRVYLMHNFCDLLDGYYFYIFFSNNFYDRIMSMTAKSSVDSVRREMIADMKIVLPPIDEQLEISKALSDMDKEIDTLNKRLNKTQQIKQGMMQELLTGKTRLLKPEQKVT
jgi:type I restriction enzyme S subunit